MSVPEDKESEDVAMGDEYLMRWTSEGHVRTIEVATKRRFQTRTIHVVRLSSAIKPEAFNVSQRLQRTTWTQATWTEIWRISAVWFSSNASGQTDRQTNRYTPGTVS